MLKGRINGAEIEVKGPADSFPNADMLSLKVTEVPEDKKDLVQAAMEQKAQESGISVNKMKAVDIKIIADGEETEPQGDVTVRFSNVTLERSRTMWKRRQRRRFRRQQHRPCSG